MKKDVIIIGAGASGLMCAIEAGKRGRSVMVIDHADKPGKKLRISGGGRCNFTNIHMHPEAYLSENPHFCKSALARFTPSDFISRLEKHGIKFFEKEAGQLFCNDSSLQLINMLQEECRKAGAEILLECRIEDISKKITFELSTSCGVLESENLVVATGGRSYPAIGATDLGYRIARQFGLKITALKPALVPLVLASGEQKSLSALSGISVDAVVSCNQKFFRGKILFTHRGLSGPAILQASMYWNKGEALSVNLLPDLDAYALFMEKQHSRQVMLNLLAEHLPKRLSQTLCEGLIQSKPLNQYTHCELMAIALNLHNWIIKPVGTEGYDKAEITLGGVDTNELSSRTMEAKKVPGLYFIGEVVDVTGQLGGYNLQWAWSSGCAAGQYA